MEDVIFSIGSEVFEIPGKIKICLVRILQHLELGVRNVLARLVLVLQVQSQIHSTNIQMPSP